MGTHDSPPGDGPTEHQHEHQHENQQGHQHGHHHDHDRGPDFDWEAMADSLELDGSIMLPLVSDVVQSLSASVNWSQIGHVLDVGCGPGVIAGALARHAPWASVTGLDTSEPLLERLQTRMAADGLGERVIAVNADLEAPLPPMEPADVIWASMVLHHVNDPAAVLASLLQQLRPGGTLVLVEFAGPAAVLPSDDPLLASGAWSRLESNVAAVLRERLGLDPVTLDWPGRLATAGFTAIADRTRVAWHDAPLEGRSRRWIAQHVNRGLRTVGDMLPTADIAALQDLVDLAARRSDLFVRIERRVITARRP